MPSGIYKRKPFTEKCIENMRIAQRKRWENPEEREKMRKAMKRRKLSIEHKRKIGESKEDKKRKPFTDKWKKNISKATKGKNNPMYGKHHTEETKRKLKQNWQNGRFDDVFQSPTQPEKEIMRILENLKLDYIFQFRPDGYSRVYDFYILEMNLLIEYDSKYWHRNTQERDAEKTRYAKDNDYKLLRINEKNLSDFKNIIKNSII